MSETPLYGSVPSAVSVPTASSTDAPKRKTRIHHLAEMKQNGERWSMLTAYDYSTARIFEDAGIPVLLVGDSAANVVYGYDTTVPITVDELLPLVRGVVRGAPHALVVADLPFGTYEGSAEQALATATRFMKEGLAHAVKLEGGERMSKQIAAITSAGIPVMAHVGFTPQSVNSLGGFRVQGRGDAAEQLVADALQSRKPGRSPSSWKWFRPRSRARSAANSPSPPSASGPVPNATLRYSYGRTWRVTRVVRQPSSSSVSVTSVTNCVPQPQPMHQKFALALSRPQNTVSDPRPANAACLSTSQGCVQ